MFQSINIDDSTIEKYIGKRNTDYNHDQFITFYKVIIIIFIYIFYKY